MSTNIRNNLYNEVKYLINTAKLTDDNSIRGFAVVDNNNHKLFREYEEHGLLVFTEVKNDRTYTLQEAHFTMGGCFLAEAAMLTDKQKISDIKANNIKDCLQYATIWKSETSRYFLFAATGKADYKRR